MADLLTPADIELKAAAMGLTMAQVSKLAGVANNLFWRWKTKKCEPRLDSYRRIVAVVTPPAASEPASPDHPRNEVRFSPRGHQAA